MIYNVRQVNVTRLLLVTTLILTVTGGLLIYLEPWEKNDPLLLVILFGGVCSSLVYFFYWNDSELIVKFEGEGILIDNTLVKWNEITSYKIIDDNPEVKIIKIKTNDGRTFNIAHRKKFKAKDDLERFQNTFLIKVNELNIAGVTNITEIPLIWESKWGKAFGYFILVIIIALTITLFVIGFKGRTLVNYFILLAIAIPLLIRIFYRK